MSNIYQRYTGECYEHLGECLSEGSLMPMVLYRVLPDSKRYVMQKSLWDKKARVKGRSVARFKMVETDLTVEEFEDRLRREDEALNAVKPSRERRGFDVPKMPMWPWFVLPVPYVLLLFRAMDSYYSWPFAFFLSPAFFLLCHFIAYVVMVVRLLADRPLRMLSQKEFPSVNKEMRTTRYALLAFAAVLCVLDVLMVWLSPEYETSWLILAFVDIVMTVGSFGVAFACFKALDWSLGQVAQRRVKRFYWYRSDMPVGEIGKRSLREEGRGDPPAPFRGSCEPCGREKTPQPTLGGEGSQSLGLGASIMAGFMLSDLLSKSSSRSDYDNNAPMESFMSEEDSYYDWACGHDDPYDCNNDDCY